MAVYAIPIYFRIRGYYPHSRVPVRSGRTSAGRITCSLRVRKAYRDWKRVSIFFKRGRRSVLGLRELMGSMGPEAFSKALKAMENPDLEPLLSNFSNLNSSHPLFKMDIDEVAYNFLSRRFNVPRKCALESASPKLHLNTGINDALFSRLKSCVESRLSGPFGKLCFVSFGEMSVSPNLKYDESYDCFIGLEDLGGGKRSINLADKATLFLVSGIDQRFKQPVSFVFHSSMKSADLVDLLTDVIKAILSTGLVVMATVCDHKATNVAAINTLIERERAQALESGEKFTGEYFSVDGCKIIPIFDFPRLLLGLRDEMLEHPVLQYQLNGKKKEAKWEHILAVYKYDRLQNPPICKYLTDEHCVPGKIQKSNVNKCAQVFSKSMTNLLKYATKINVPGVPRSAFETANLVYILDRLFDSVNGSTIEPIGGSILRAACQPGSEHINCWEGFIKIFDSMIFRTSSGTELKTSSIINWARSLRNFIQLILQLRLEIYTYMYPRRINMDPLENLFGAIRVLDGEIVTPTCSTFIKSLETLLLNNLESEFHRWHFEDANCEEDGLWALDSFGDVRGSLLNSKAPVIDSEVYTSIPDCSSDLVRAVVPSLADVYAAFFVFKQVMAISEVRNCWHCRPLLQARQPGPQHVLILRMERRKQKQEHIYPSDLFVKAYVHVKDVIVKHLPSVCHLPLLSHNLTRLLIDECNFTNEFSISCLRHRLASLRPFLQTIIKMEVQGWCRIVNRYLKGQYKDMPKEDEVFLLAYNVCQGKKSN